MPQLSDHPAPESEGSITVLLVDDEALMRAGLRLILDGAENIRVVGEAENGAHAVDRVRELAPDVVLMDIRMPGTDGIAGCRSVRSEPDPPQVVMLTAFDTDAFILEALEAGAVGFLLKDTPPRQLVRAVKDAAEGTSSVSPSVLSRLIEVATAHGHRPVSTHRKPLTRVRGNPRSPRRRQLARIRWGYSAIGNVKSPTPWRAA